MAKIARFLLVLFFPVLGFADGISVDSTTLQSAHFSFLVKLIAIDAARHLAKVKILRKYRSPANVAGQECGALSTKVFDSKNDLQADSVPWDELDRHQEVVLRMRRPVQAHAGKWVIEERYWDRAREVKPGETYFAAMGNGHVEWIEFSKDRETKFELVYDPAKRGAEIKKLNVESLVAWLPDEDLRSFAIAELNARKEMKISNLLKPGMKKNVFGILLSWIQGLQPSERKSVLREGYDFALAGLKQNSLDQNLVVEFTKIFSYHPKERPGLELEYELLSLLKLEPGKSEDRDPVRKQIDEFHYEVKERLNQEKPVALEKVLDQVIQIYENMGDGVSSSPHLSLDRFYNNLKGEPRSIMFQKLAKCLARIGHQHVSSSTMQGMLYKLKETPDLRAAKIVMEVDFEKAPTNIKVAALEAVFASFDQSQERENPKTRQAVLAFLDRYIDPRIPTFLSAETMAKYHSLKAK